MTCMAALRNCIKYKDQTSSVYGSGEGVFLRRLEKRTQNLWHLLFGSSNNPHLSWVTVLSLFCPPPWQATKRRLGAVRYVLPEHAWMHWWMPHFHCSDGFETNPAGIHPFIHSCIYLTNNKRGGDPGTPIHAIYHTIIKWLYNYNN